ncbi:hypothetical protein [Corynebacterium lowii]|uniref:Uncharacterized protein n=1 Tax=Corynebacterium lowii TaxID=1544413 RepID=A0A0Q0U5L5_9CORY|nr:hypothetical protein [Corynebacterium lowii]KQB87308.1 hypothetical protein Clow_00363 [Corynebacterium lowii]MDP9852104.1 hypothetical protein [Corynebacterium lowii]
MSADSSSQVPGALRVAYWLSVAGAVLMLLSAFIALSDISQATEGSVRVNLGVVGGTNLVAGVLVASFAAHLSKPGKPGLRARRIVAAAITASIAVSVLGLITQAVGVAILLHVIVLAFAALAMFRPAASDFLRGISE